MVSRLGFCRDLKRQLGVARKLAQVTLGLFFVASALPLLADSSNEREAVWQQINQQLQSLSKIPSAAAKAGERIDPKQVSQRRQAIIQRAMDLYRQQPADTLSVDAMLLTLYESRGRETYIEVCQNLLDYHIDHPSLHQFFPLMSSLARFENDCEEMLLKAARQGASNAVRDAAKLHLASVYRMMSELLANLAELDMTMEQYTTSKTLSSFGSLSSEEALSISKHLCESDWQTRDWRQVKEQALALVKPLLNSEEQIPHYLPDYKGVKSAPSENISDRASDIHYQLLNSTPGARLAEFEFRDFDGEPVRLEDHLGKVVLIDVWATWCPPCVTGMEGMKTLQQSMRGKPFSLITISIDNQLEEAKRFAAKKPMPFDNWYVGDDREFFDQWGVYYIPRMIVLDAQGVVRAVPDVGQEDLFKYVSRLVSNVKQ